MRTSLATSLLLAALTLSSETLAVESQSKSSGLWNWSKNIEFTARHRDTPSTVDELAALVRDSRRVKVVGTTHSFNDIADTEGTQVSLEKMTDIQVDVENKLVTFGAGVTFTMLIKALT